MTRVLMDYHSAWSRSINSRLNGIIAQAQNSLRNLDNIASPKRVIALIIEELTNEVLRRTRNGSDFPVAEV